MAKVINNSKAKLQAFEKANEVLVPVPLSQPTPLINAIAELGNFTPPPPTSSTPTPDVATIPYGYPIKQAQTIESGGLPVQRLETNGLFNLVSSFIKYWSQGGATKFDSTFGIAPGQGYTTGSVLYYADPTNPNNAINGWYTKLNNNADTTFPNINWKQITNVTPPAPLQLYQQGRMTCISGSPYSDTTPNGSATLYFTPTENGNLISLWNGTNWVTQSFNELSLPISVNQGTLQALSTPTIATGFNPQGVVTHPNGTFLYVTNNLGSAVNGSVSEYIRSTSGVLTILGTLTGAGLTPNAITITPDAGNIYWTVGGQINIYQATINTDGGLTLINSTISTGGQGNGIVISPNSNFVYVCGGSGNNFVYQFSRNLNGSLSALSTTKIATGTNPTAISISPNGNNVYVTNGSDRTVSQYSRNSGTGLLSLIGTTATISSTVPVGIIVSPDGLNVYVTNQGTNTISQYSRATDTGLLTLIVTTSPLATETTPTEITISPDGSFVYVINNGSRTISQYRRNSSTGLLTVLGTPNTIATANTPTGINISADGNNVYVTNNGSGTGSNTVSEYSISKITDVTLIQDATYDIYVGINASGVLTLINNAWTNNNTIPPTRTQINGKWVNGADNTKLLLGSINVKSGVVQSWNGNRGIWNLYNQVALGLLAFQTPDSGNIDWSWSSGRWHDQKSNNDDGKGKLTFLIDPLYNKQLTFRYEGSIAIISSLNGGTVGIVLNTDLPDTGTLPTFTVLVAFSIGNITQAATGGAKAPFNVSYTYQFNNANTTSLPNGLNFIQKAELGIPNTTSGAFFTDSGGLTAEFWG